MLAGREAIAQCRTSGWFSQLRQADPTCTTLAAAAWHFLLSQPTNIPSIIHSRHRPALLCPHLLLLVAALASPVLLLLLLLVVDGHQSLRVGGSHCRRGLLLLLLDAPLELRHIHAALELQLATHKRRHGCRVVRC